MAGILDLFMPQDFMNPANSPRRPAPGAMPPMNGLPGNNLMQAFAQPAANAAAPDAAPVAAPPAPMPAPGAIREPIGIPDVAARPGDGMIMAAVNGPTTGPIINNGGTLSNAGGNVGFDPIRGQASTPDDRGLSALGFAQGVDGNLRRAGSYGQHEQQMNLMQELQRMAAQSAPGINALDTATRTQQQAARDNYMGNQMQSLMQSFAPGIMPNALGQQRLGLDRDIQYGLNGVPGAIQNAATNAQTAARGVENARSSEDNAADAASELALRQRMQLYRIPEEQAARELTAANPNFRLPRRLGGGSPGHNNNPVNSIGNLQGTQPPAPTPGTSLPSPLPVANGIPPQGNGNVMQDVAARTALENALRRGMNMIPEVRTMGANGMEQVSRAPYSSENHNAYLQAITSAIGALPDQQLQNNWDQVRQGLTGSFGGEPVMQAWQNQNYYSNPFTGSPLGLSSNSTETSRQLQRMARINRARTGQAAPSGIPFSAAGMGGPNAVGEIPLGAVVPSLGLLNAPNQWLRSALGTQ